MVEIQEGIQEVLSQPPLLHKQSLTGLAGKTNHMIPNQPCPALALSQDHYCVRLEAVLGPKIGTDILHMIVVSSIILIPFLNL